MDKFDINSLGIVLALVGAVLAALLGGIGSAIGVAFHIIKRQMNIYVSKLNFRTTGESLPNHRPHDYQSCALAS